MSYWGTLSLHFYGLSCRLHFTLHKLTNKEMTGKKLNLTTYCVIRTHWKNIGQQCWESRWQAALCNKSKLELVEEKKITVITTLYFFVNCIRCRMLIINCKIQFVCIADHLVSHSTLWAVFLLCARTANSQSGLSLTAIARNTCYGWAHTTVTGVDVYWCCIGATINLHTYCTGMGDDYDVMAA